MDECFNTLLSSKSPSSLFASDLFFAGSSFAPSSSSITRGTLNPRRQKQLACERCHAQKVRCVRSRFIGDTCDRCRQAGVQCVGRAAQRMGRPSRSQEASTAKAQQHAGGPTYDTDEAPTGHKRRRTWGGITEAEPTDAVDVDPHMSDFSPWSKKIDSFEGFVFDPTVSREGDSGASTSSTFENEVSFEQALSSHPSTSPQSHADLDGNPGIGNTDLMSCLIDSDLASQEQDQAQDQRSNFSNFLDVLASCETLLSKAVSEASAQDDPSLLNSETQNATHQKPGQHILSGHDLEQLFTISHIFTDTLRGQGSPFLADESPSTSSLSLQLLTSSERTKLMAVIMCYLRLLQIWKIALASMAEEGRLPSTGVSDLSSTRLSFGESGVDPLPHLQVLLLKQLSTYLLRQMHRTMHVTLSQYGLEADFIDAPTSSLGGLSNFMLRHMLSDVRERERAVQNSFVDACFT